MRRAVSHIVVLVAMLTCAGVGRAQDHATLSAALNQNALRAGEDALLAVVLDIKAGYHAQSHKPLESYLIPFRIEIDANPALEVGAPIYPEAHIEDFAQLGRMSIYTGRTIAYVPFRAKPDAPTGSIAISGRLEYQICDDSVCFAPQTSAFKLETRIVAPGEPVQPNQPELFAGYEKLSAEAASPVARAPTTLASFPGTRWTTSAAFGAAFLAGLLFNIMPCVLPVLPIKAKGFYEVAHHHRSQAFVFGLVFSLGMISVFAVLAMIVLVLKAFTWGELFSQPWFIWPVIGLIVVLAMGLFGGYDVGLPAFVYSFQPRHDTYPGNFFWGALMAILATPCTAPLLPPLLAWATLQPATVGVPSVVMVGVGMAFPYLILSGFPELARGIPRSGPWAELFKQMLGFMMLAAAAYFAAGRFIPGAGFMWAVVAVVAVAALYLLARTVQITKSALPVGISAILAVAMLGGVLWWTARLNAAHASWRAYSDTEFAAARASGKPVLVKFTANWCATCQVIEGSVFQDEQVWAALRSADVIAIKADLTRSDAPGWALLRQLNPAGGIPLTAIYPARSDDPIILASYYNSDALLEALHHATSESRAGSHSPQGTGLGERQSPQSRQPGQSHVRLRRSKNGRAKLPPSREYRRVRLAGASPHSFRVLLDT